MRASLLALSLSILGLGTIVPGHATIVLAAPDPAQELARLDKQLTDDVATLDALNDQVQKAQADLDRLNRLLLEDQQRQAQLAEQLSQLARAAYQRPPPNVIAIINSGHPDEALSQEALARLIASKQQQLLAEAERLRVQDQQARDQQVQRLAQITSARDQASQVAVQTLTLRNAASNAVLRARAQTVTNQAMATQAAAVQPVFTPLTGAGPISNHFPAGYCTWYVASRRDIPWFGNAFDWWQNAQPYGYAEGQVPQVGAIMVTRESIAYGHVAYVEAVNRDGSWTVSEMNFVGWNVKSGRTIKPGQLPLVGFIYGKA
jgi:surface antigen